LMAPRPSRSLRSRLAERLNRAVGLQVGYPLVGSDWLTWEMKAWQRGNRNPSHTPNTTRMDRYGQRVRPWAVSQRAIGSISERTALEWALAHSKKAGKLGNGPGMTSKAESSRSLSLSQKPSQRSDDHAESAMLRQPGARPSGCAFLGWRMKSGSLPPNNSLKLTRWAGPQLRLVSHAGVP
jgi:hypothetical protein